MSCNVISMHLVGPYVEACRRLSAAYLREEGNAEANIIDVVWKDAEAVIGQLNKELEYENRFYISIGNMVDVVSNRSRRQTRNSLFGLINGEKAAEVFKPYVRDINEAGQVLNRYRQSLVILVDNRNDGDPRHDEIGSTIANLHELGIPFYHMRELDLCIQVKILQRAVSVGELPSPFASLSFYELSSKPKKKERCVDKNELDRFYGTFNLPFYIKQNKNGTNITGVRSIFVGESTLRQSIEAPLKGRTNRLFWKRGNAGDLFLLEFERSISSSSVLRLLKGGILIQGEIHSFLGCSSSGLKKRKAYLIKGSEQVAIDERQKYGNFESLATASKQISRFSLLLTNVVITDLTPIHFKDECDVEMNKYCFTDGCGKISTDLAAALFRQSRPILSRQYGETVPSVFQMRWQGFKGIVVLDSTLPIGTMVVRPSMKKFKTESFPEICLCDYSRPYSFGHLNRQYITLLSGLGVPDENFLSIQKDFFDQIRKMTSEYSAALQILEWHNRSDELIDDKGDNLQTRLLKLKSLQTQLISSAPKLKILVPESRILFGVAETPKFCPTTKKRLPGILKYGECLIRVTMKGGHKISLQNQKVVVSKNPCYLLGDVRVLTAVSSLQRPELESVEKDLVDCIVFPVEGSAPHSVEIAGSDLDGDQYFVCWDARMIPPRTDKPYNYPSFEARNEHKHKPNQIDLITYFSGQNIVSDLMGQVDSNYKAWAAIKGPSSDECIRLGQLFSRVVDSAKSGERVKLDPSFRVPSEKRPSPTPSSKFVWQKLEHLANDFVEEQLKNGNFIMTDSSDNRDDEVDDYVQDEEEIEDEKDFFFDLVSRNHLAMSEFTKFRLIMQHLRSIETFFHSKFASCVDFGHLNEYELGYIVYTYHMPHAVLSNSLKYCSRIINQTIFFKKYVDTDQVPWKFYWRGETSANILYFSDVLLHALRKNTDALLALKLPDSVVIVLRFSLPFEESKKSRKVILFNEQNTCIDKPLKDFINVSSVFVSSNFGYADEYTLIDDSYRIAIDMTNKSLQIYRGEKRATFAHLQVDDMPNGGMKRVQLSVDLTRFNRRILNGKIRHPLVRKVPVFDIELFVSNRASPYARIPKKIALADILLEDGDKWTQTMPPYQAEILLNDDDCTMRLYQEQTAEILRTIQEKFIAMGLMNCSSDMLVEFLETVLYPSHGLFGMSGKISSELQERVSMSVELVFNEISQVGIDDHTTLLLVTNLIPILSDLGISLPFHDIPISDHFESSTVLRHLGRTIRRWDLFLTLSPLQRVAILSWLNSMVGSLDDPLRAYTLRNLCEQANVLFHDLRDGSEDIRSSSSVSRLVNLRIEPSASTFDDTIEKGINKSEGKMPIVTLYSIQAVPVALRFSIGEHVCILKQPSKSENIRSETSHDFSVLQDDWDKEFPALSRTIFTQARRKENEFVSKQACFCLGRVVSITDAPFSIKLKLLAPSYIAESRYMPQLIKDCLKEKKNIWFELQVIPANVVAHERIVDATLLCLDPREDNNLFIGPKICQYLIPGLSTNDGRAVDDAVRNKTELPQTTLNSRQQEAMVKSISNTISLVHGPPGTGKTTTITHIIKAILRSSDDRIIVCAETNLAVDNLALRMLDDDKCSEFPGFLIRLGSGDKVDDRLKAIHLEALVKGRIPKTSAHTGDAEKEFYLSRHKKIMNEILSHARVIFATTIGAGDPILNGQRFEFVVMDEASMSTEPSCLPALSHGCSRLVLVGDHKQLGPHAIDSQCVSLFERLLLETESEAKAIAVTMLNQQHRMHSKLCQFPSKTFYDEKLLTGPGIDEARPIPNAVFGGKLPIKFVPVKNGREQRMKSGSWYNKVEIGYVLKIIEDLTKRGGEDKLKGNDITILTPYRAQQARIQIQLQNTWGNTDHLPEVCSIDGYQGRENEIIVFSAVRCGSSLGFCDDARRINVLLTRAKRGLVVLGDRNTLRKSGIWNQWVDMVERGAP